MSLSPSVLFFDAAHALLTSKGYTQTDTLGVYDAKGAYYPRVCVLVNDNTYSCAYWKQGELAHRKPCYLFSAQDPQDVLRQMAMALHTGENEDASTDPHSRKAFATSQK